VHPNFASEGVFRAKTLKYFQDFRRRSGSGHGESGPVKDVLVKQYVAESRREPLLSSHTAARTLALTVFDVPRSLERGGRRRKATLQEYLAHKKQPPPPRATTGLSA
jgi:hypothetical protein